MASFDAPTNEEDQTTLRPPKRRMGPGKVILPTALDPSQSISDVGSEISEVTSHNSGRMSPTKQLMALEDLDNPILARPFDADHKMPVEARRIRDGLRPLCDGVGILGCTAEDLEAHRMLLNNDDDRARFSYPWTTDYASRPNLGRDLPLRHVQAIVREAIQCDTSSAHEEAWNENVHSVILKQTIHHSIHDAALEVPSFKTARIDPPSLADASLPRRVIDYGIVLSPHNDPIMQRAWKHLKPLPGAHVKSWNNNTMRTSRDKPIAISIETKAPSKSWSNGIPQLAIWNASLYKRLRMIKHRRIPATPLLIAQGHDWFCLIFAEQTENDRGHVLWHKMDIGSTRNCFDLCKLVSILHWLADWAQMVWRPHFHTLIDELADTS